MARETTVKDRTLDTTSGVVWQQLLQLLWPVFIGSFITQAYQLVNTFVLGRFATTEALGGIQATSAVYELVVGFCVGVGAGCAIIVGQFFGAHDEDKLRVSVKTSMTLAVVIGAIFSIVGIIGIEPLLLALGTPKELLGEALDYSRLFLATLVFELIYSIGGGILRAVGDTRTPTVVLVISLVVAAALDILFVAGFGMGALGCGISYLISFIEAAAHMVWCLMKASDTWGLDLRDLRPDMGIARSMVLTGLPLGLQSSAYAVSNLIVQASINTFGAVTVTGWGLSARIDGIIWMVCEALGISVTTFCAQNYGARNEARIRQGLKESLIMSVALIGGMSAVVVLLSGPIATFFVGPGPVADAARTLLHVIGPTYFLYSISCNISGAIRGTGESVGPMVITLLGTCVLRIAWVLLLMPAFHTEFALMMCYPFTWIVTDIAFVAYWRSSRWLHERDA